MYSSASLDVGVSAGPLEMRFIEFCICQQADSYRTYIHFFYSVTYPNDFPSQYSIIAPFEVAKGSPQLGWDLWQVSNSDACQHLCPDRQAISGSLLYHARLNVPDQDSQEYKKDSDGSWHKIALSKKENNTKLPLDF